jgi:hypothetical protein
VPYELEVTSSNPPSPFPYVDMSKNKILVVYETTLPTIHTDMNDKVATSEDRDINVGGCNIVQTIWLQGL